MREQLKTFALLLLITAMVLTPGCTKKICRELKYLGSAFIAGAAASGAYVGNIMGIRKRKSKKPVVESKRTTTKQEGSNK